MMANITFLSFLLFSMCHSIHVAVNTWLNCSFFTLILDIINANSAIRSTDAERYCHFVLCQHSALFIGSYRLTNDRILTRLVTSATENVPLTRSLIQILGDHFNDIRSIGSPQVIKIQKWHGKSTFFHRKSTLFRTTFKSDIWNLPSPPHRFRGPWIQVRRIKPAQLDFRRTII